MAKLQGLLLKKIRLVNFMLLSLLRNQIALVKPNKSSKIIILKVKNFISTIMKFKVKNLNVKTLLDNLNLSLHSPSFKVFHNLE